MSEQLVVEDLEPRDFWFEWRGQKYWGTEADGGTGSWYRATRSGMARMAEGKVVGINASPDLEPMLVSKCLYKADKDGNLPLKDGKPDPAFLVHVSIVRSMPDRLQSKAFHHIKKISNLDADEETAEVLEARIAADTKKLAELRGRAEGNGRQEDAQSRDTPLMSATSG